VHRTEGLPIAGLVITGASAVQLRQPVVRVGIVSAANPVKPQLNCFGVYTERCKPSGPSILR